MKIIEKNAGQKIDYELNGTKLSFADGALTLDLARRQRDNAVTLDIMVEKKYYRKTTTQELDVELEWLRHLVRMAADKECCGPKFAPPLSTHQYEVWARFNNEIGCMLGGYIKSLNR